MLNNLIDRIKLSFRKDKELYSSLYAILGFYPRHIDNYKMALMHKSIMHRNSKGKPVNNERLEFLGDAILDAIVGDIVYHHFPGKREGFLTNTRSKLVQRDTLNKLSQEMGIDQLILSNGHSASHNSYLGGNAFEALVGAIYLDKNEDLPEGEHNYIFVGRVGQFCPIMPGKGGALLLREAGLTDTGERKYASVTGAKDYRWLESEAVYQLQMQEDIDKRYFNREVDEAVEEISKYGDFNWFVGDDGVAPWTAPDLPWSDAQEEAARNFDVR